MRFTKIPLIATLMAVALSLLIVLPALAQNYDDTRGVQKSGANLQVTVLDGTSSDMANSYFNGLLYVSNDDGAHHRVQVAAEAPTLKKVDLNATPTPNDDTDDTDCATATVKNSRTGKSIKVQAQGNTNDDTGTNGGWDFSTVFMVIPSGDEQADAGCYERTATGDAITVGKIPARHGDTLTVTVAGVSGSISLTVDAEGPEFSGISPADKVYLPSQTIKFRFTVTDSDSGLAHDGELDYSRGDTDARAINGDNDSFTSGEPRSVTGGAARDIKVMLDEGSGLKDKSASGNSGWRNRGANGKAGVSYFLDMAVTNVPEGAREWRLEATDRAGNMAQTDANASKSGKQNFTLTVDVTSPEFREAYTGISYDSTKQKEIFDRSSILVIFEDGKGALDAVRDVDASKFLVEGHDVTEAIHLSDKSSDCNQTNKADNLPVNIDGDCLKVVDVPRSRVYLQLAEALAPDATPQVSMFGGAVLDLAGNPSNQDEVDARDAIAPGITVTVSTAVGDRPVIRNNGEITIAITSDEDLRRLPTVYFAQVVDGGSSTADKQSVKLGANRRGDRVSTAGGVNSWSRTYTNSDIGSADSLYAVIVIAEDDADNIGSTPGWDHKRSDNAPTAGKKADIGDLEDAGLLVEIDKDLADPTFSLAPETDEGTKTTESASPFVTIDFAGEKDEYGNYVDSAGKKISNFGDSHSAVQITSITLNGNDVSGQTSPVSDRKYTLHAQDLSTGNYELKVTGMDDAGNTVSDSYKFEVAARKPYKVDLIPGWNLVSIPGTPLDSSTGSVMGATAEAAIVLAYQDDAWLTAVNDNGTWRGTLTDIVGGYGYWVQTTAFESISTLIPETDTSSVLPTAKVIEGWNLLGVVDVRQAKAGSVPSGGGEADDYFGNIKWKVAYSFNTSDNAWSKSIPGAGTDDEVANGKGYWVWSTEAGTLVP